MARHQGLVNGIILGASIAIAIASKGEGGEGLEGEEGRVGEPAEGEVSAPQFKRLSQGEIKQLKKQGIDPEDLKPNSKYDLFKDNKGNIFVKPKDGSGAGEPTGINIKDLY